MILQIKLNFANSVLYLSICMINIFIENINVIMLIIK